jgi:hypothetical protein
MIAAPTRQIRLSGDYHYEYTVAIAADGAGTVTMVPDYPGDEVSVWTESFTLDQAALDELYRQLAAIGAFTTGVPKWTGRRWAAVMPRPA